jgi:hypothetical protein
VNRLFIELYLDEDVDVVLVDLLSSRGFSATTTQEAGQTGANDSAQLAWSVAHEKTLFTHNRADFETLAREYFETSRTHYGIIIAVRRLPHELARRLLVILNDVTADDMTNQLIYI